MKFILLINVSFCDLNQKFSLILAISEFMSSYNLGAWSWLASEKKQALSFGNHHFSYFKTQIKFLKWFERDFMTSISNDNQADIIEAFSSTSRYEPRREKTGFFAYAKTKTQISFAVTAKLISVFVFATRIVQSLYFLNPKFQVPSHLQWLSSPVCVGPGRNPRRRGFLTSRLIFRQSTKYCCKWVL